MARAPTPWPLAPGKSGHHNGAQEMARRRRQMERGDVLNWYPGQVRANWRG